MKINIDNVVGYKCYKELEDHSIELVRVIRKQNQDTVVINGNNTPNRKIKLDDLKKEYSFLKPDGYISFSIVKLEQDCKDIIVSLHRRSDLDKGENTPYCVCRQNIMDLHANMIRKSNIEYVGACISIDTIPEGVPYQVMTACEGIDTFYTVAVYLNDTLETMLSFINITKYDLVLSDLYRRGYNNLKIRGYSKTLKELLIENNFMYDFCRGFNIIPIDKIEGLDKLFGDDDATDAVQLNGEICKFLEFFTRYKLNNPMALRYDIDVDLSEIKVDYILISYNNVIYIIKYEKGEEYDFTTNKEFTSDARKYMESVKFSKTKY